MLRVGKQTRQAQNSASTGPSPEWEPCAPQHSGTPLDTVLLRPGCVSMKGKNHLKMGRDLVNNPQQLGSCNRQGCLSYPLLLRPALDLWPVVQATCLGLQFHPQSLKQGLGFWMFVWELISPVRKWWPSGSREGITQASIAPRPSVGPRHWKVFFLVPTAHWSKVAPGVLTRWHWWSAHGRKFSACRNSLQATSRVGWASVGRIPTASEFSQVTSLVIHWLRLHLPMQGVRVQSLVGELRSYKTQGQKSQNINNRSNIVTTSIKTSKMVLIKKNFLSVNKMSQFSLAQKIMQRFWDQQSLIWEVGKLGMS